jgi:DNA-binding MarR family transcriptional regulator
MDAGPNCVAYRVRKLSRVISAIYDEQFAPLNLKGSQFNLLGMLSRFDHSTATDLCRMAAMDKSTASRNLRRMQQRGWISVAKADSGRWQEVSLTREGLRILRAAYPLWQKAQAEAMRRLGSHGVGALEKLLENAQR